MMRFWSELSSRAPLILLLYTLVWSRQLGASGGQSPSGLCVDGPESNSVVVYSDCTWSTALRSLNLAVVGGRAPDSLVNSSTPATTAIFAANPVSTTADGAIPGARLYLERLVLVGFPISAPASPQPLLWPEGFMAHSGQMLNMSDVRLAINNRKTFSALLQFFTNDKRVMLWTDNASFVHIHQWSDSRTFVRSVSILLQGTQLPNPVKLPEPLVKNCIVTATNATLVPSLLAFAGVATPQPLLVYVTSNVSIGAHPKLPPAGILISRPVIFVGLQSSVTSIDFQMVVNLLNETGNYANVTFVELVLENLAPGDSVTSTVAAPFSIVVTNNVWAVYYNRTVPNVVRLAFLNCTLVLPLESEMVYVTYMFTLFSSPLPYLQQQTSFYTDVLHMTIAEYTPGPGSHSLTIHRMKSWYHWWNSVVLTSEYRVAAPLPVPPRPLMLSNKPGRASPLVQAVSSVSELVSFGEHPALGDREYILLILADINLEASSDGNTLGPVQLNSSMSWLGSSPADAAAGTAAAANQSVATPQVSVMFGYRRSAVLIPRNGSIDVTLNLQQMLLGQLPQGAGAAAAVARKDKYLPKQVLTILLWCFDRPLVQQLLVLNSVVLMLPAAELKYLQAAARQQPDFVISVAGDKLDTLTFEDVMLSDDDLLVGFFKGPGISGTNITLVLDPNAAAAMPGGYVWPDPSQMLLPAGRSAPAKWAIAVIVVSTTLGALLLLLGGFIWRRRRVLWQGNSLDGKNHPLVDGSMKGSHIGSCLRSSEDRPSLHNGSKDSMSVRGTSVVCKSPHCAVCMALQQNNIGSAGLFVSVTPTGSCKHVVAICNKDPSIKHGIGYLQQQQQGVQHALRDDTESHQDAAAAAAQHVNDSLEDRVSAGMQRWRAAVSSTTMLLMQRRMDASSGLPVNSGGSSIAAGSICKAGSSSTEPNGAIAVPATAAVFSTRQPLEAGLQQQQHTDEAVAAGCQQGSCIAHSSPPLQLQVSELLGQGSFGCVYLATWRGKRVAVKVMQLPATAMLGLQQAEEPAADDNSRSSLESKQEQQRRQRASQIQQRMSAPHMAIMEAVLSSTMSHPNVVQVYTYMVNPLTSGSVTGEAFDGMQCGLPQAAVGRSKSDIAGWELKLVMEYCDEGSLRDGLDCGLLAQPGSYLAPSIVLTLAHDVAAAMLHLHSEGIVHGDLKAGNVMLTGSSSSSTCGNDSRVWAATGSRCLTAKVADFGLAMPLGPSDTHATLMARGTPTHMAPELFLQGRVSKASDVYAYGIMLYEVITRERAYAGVPIPLLPHEVARQGLRPQWPSGLPPGCKELQRLAEACWAQRPQGRPSFADILRALDYWAAGNQGWPLCTVSSLSSLSHSDCTDLLLQQQQEGSTTNLSTSNIEFVPWQHQQEDQQQQAPHQQQGEQQQEQQVQYQEVQQQPDVWQQGKQPQQQGSPNIGRPWSDAVPLPTGKAPVRHLSLLVQQLNLNAAGQTGNAGDDGNCPCPGGKDISWSEVTYGRLS